MATDLLNDGLGALVDFEVSRFGKQDVSFRKLRQKLNGGNRISDINKQDINMCYVDALWDVVREEQGHENGWETIDRIISEYHSHFVDTDVRDLQHVHGTLTGKRSFFRHVDALSYHILVNMTLRELDVKTEEKREEVCHKIGEYGFHKNPFSGFIGSWVFPRDFLVGNLSRNMDWFTTVVDAQPVVITDEDVTVGEKGKLLTENLQPLIMMK